MAIEPHVLLARILAAGGTIRCQTRGTLCAHWPPEVEPPEDLREPFIEGREVLAAWLAEQRRAGVAYLWHTEGHLVAVGMSVAAAALVPAGIVAYTKTDLEQLAAVADVPQMHIAMRVFGGRLTGKAEAEADGGQLLGRASNG